MSGPDRAGVLVGLPMAFVMDSQVGLRQSDVIVFVLKIKRYKIISTQILLDLALVDQHLGRGVSSSLTMG